MLRIKQENHYTTRRSRNERSQDSNNRITINDQINSSNNSKDRVSLETHSVTFLVALACHKTTGITLTRTTSRLTSFYSQCSDLLVLIIEVSRISARKCLIHLVGFLMASDGIVTSLRIISSSNSDLQVELMEAASLTNSSEWRRNAASKIKANRESLLTKKLLKDFRSLKYQRSTARSLTMVNSKRLSVQSAQRS